MSAAKFKLVYVEWEDHSGSDGWRTLDEAQRSNDDVYLCLSVGWLIAENKRRITLAASVNEPDAAKGPVHVAGEMTIARALIKRMRVLKIR